MLRSRTFTPGFKLFSGLFAFCLTAALVVGVSTELQTNDQTVKQMLDSKGIIATVLGPITVGWKGGVGNHLAYSILLVAAVVSLGIALVLVAYRDADPEALAQAVRTETVPLTRAPAGASYTPIVAAFAVLLMGVGWVRSTPALAAGVALVLVTAGVWTIRAWAERATGDSEVNYEIFKRIIDPVRVPVLAVALIAFVVLGFSRVLLAVPDENWSRFTFLGVGAVFFAVVVAVGSRASLPRGLIAAVLVIGGLAILGGLVWGGTAGERTFEHPGSEAPAGTREGSLGPTEPVSTIGPVGQEILA